MGAAGGRLTRSLSLGLAPRGLIRSAIINKEASMKLVGASLLVLAVVLAFPRPSAAQNKTARGTISSIAGDTITVNVGGSEMKFTVDGKTMVTAAGAGTKARAAAAAGQAGPKLNELLKSGEAVVVTYM